MKPNVFGAVIVLCLLLFSVQGRCVNVPLSVHNPVSSWIRISEPVVGGVPLPEDAHVLDPSELAIVAQDGQVLPAQFKVLARWHGIPSDTTKPIKWVLVNFQGNLGKGETVDYLLTNEKANIAPALSVRVSDTEEWITVDTGMARYNLSKKFFNFFDQVFVRGGGLGPDGSRLGSTSGGGLGVTRFDGALVHERL